MAERVDRIPEPNTITPIPSYYVTPVWEKAEPLVRKAIDYVDSGYRSEDILKRLVTSEMQLWIVNEYEAAAVTMLSIYPQFKSCLVVALAGDNLDSWFDDLMSKIEDWADMMGCKYVEEYGRKGWQRVGAHRGYEHVWTVMRKTL